MTQKQPRLPYPLISPYTFPPGASFDASCGNCSAIVWLLAVPKRKETMGKRLPNGMPNEQRGRGGIEVKERWGLCREHFSRATFQSPEGSWNLQCPMP